METADAEARARFVLRTAVLAFVFLVSWFSASEGVSILSFLSRPFRPICGVMQGHLRSAKALSSA